MALAAHETKAVSNSVVSPATTQAVLFAFGSVYALMSTTNAIRFTVDGQTDPVITGSSEVGTLLSTTGEGGLTHIILTIEEFLNLRMIRVASDARVQFEFLAERRREVF